VHNRKGDAVKPASGSGSAKPARRVRRDPKNLVCGFASPAVIAERGTMQIVKGRGIYVWDSHGRKYIDGLASLWNVTIGHGRPEIARAVARQMRQIAFVPTLLGFSSPVAEELATRIAALAPRGLSRVVFTSGGSDANESVIRLVRLYWRLKQRPDKINIVALTRAYHGSSTGAASLTGLPYFHQYYEPLLPGVLRMPRPFCYRCELHRKYPEFALACADELERIIQREGADKIGAFIAEPVQGVGGVIVPPDGYHQRIREICNKHDVLMINDEVITGFGRLGYPFGINYWGVTPDMISFAKGVTSGYLPLGGVLLKEEIYQTLVDAGPGFALHHGFTYSGHPAVCAAALANLDILEGEKLMPRTRKLAPYFSRRLRSLEKHGIVGEVRAIGLMAALELVRDKQSGEPLPPEWNVPQRIRNACLARGVIVRASLDTVAVCPPLIIKENEIDLIVAALDAALTEVGAQPQP
jgi:adenosylmethionine-8-amino-7-oxononanoate aminotransferase